MTDKQSNQPSKRGAEPQKDVGQPEEVVAPVHDPDASNYLLQPTAHELSPFVGDPPADRFMEEVHKDSDEVVGSDQREAHPEENRPAVGIGPEDPVPDTTGRAAHNRRS